MTSWRCCRQLINPLGSSSGPCRHPHHGRPSVRRAGTSHSPPSCTSPSRERLSARAKATDAGTIPAKRPSGRGCANISTGIRQAARASNQLPSPLSSTPASPLNLIKVKAWEALISEVSSWSIGCGARPQPSSRRTAPNSSARERQAADICSSGRAPAPTTTRRFWDMPAR